MRTENRFRRAFGPRISEIGNVPVNVVIGALAAFVAWGRTVAAPIA